MTVMLKVRIISDILFDLKMHSFRYDVLAAEFELGEGQGADEEVCLLPDEEREISDADKERAILAKEAAEKEHEESDGDNENDQELEQDHEHDHENDGEVPADGNDGMFLLFIEIALGDIA